MGRAAYIVALGVRCPVGLTAESTAAAIRARISRIAEHPFLVDGACQKLRCGRDSLIDPKVCSAVRMTTLAEHSLGEVTRKLTRHAPYRFPAALLLALPEPRPGFGAFQARQIAAALQASPATAIVLRSVESIGTGHAGALLALEEAFQRVSERGEDLCIVGGVDSYLDEITIDWLESDLRVKRLGTRAGFAPGEAAAMVAVASDSGCAQLRLAPLARLCGVGCAYEQRSPTSDEGLLGEGLTIAIAKVLGSQPSGGGVISDLYGDINGERERTHDWGFALLRTAAGFRDGTDYVTAVGQCGDIGAATGALGCVLAVQAWQRHYASGPRALVWAGSWGGLRGAAVLQQEGW